MFDPPPKTVYKLGTMHELEGHLQSIETSLGYTFKDLKLFKKSLTHKSYANEISDIESFEDNERLEFLGDAVLDLVITDILLRIFPDRTEGDLSRLRASIVNTRQLAEMGKKLNLGELLFLGKGEERTKGREKKSILANTYEAILGALYLDAGYQTTYRLIEAQFQFLLKRCTQEDIDLDFKTRLQEQIQKKYKQIPKYTVTKETGPDHNKVFHVTVSLGQKPLAFGSGKNKKQAEQHAASAALQILNEDV